MTGPAKAFQPRSDSGRRSHGAKPKSAHMILQVRYLEIPYSRLSRDSQHTELALRLVKMDSRGTDSSPAQRALRASRADVTRLGCSTGRGHNRSFTAFAPKCFGFRTHQSSLGVCHLLLRIRLVGRKAHSVAWHSLRRSPRATCSVIQHDLAVSSMFA